jgi:hypothetical protein
MVYYLGRDVVVAFTTEIAGQGVDVESDGTVDTFAAADGTGNSGADTLFAGPRARRNAANSPNTNFSSANTTVFGTQDSTNDYTNEQPDVTGVDVSLGVQDEDITYVGNRTNMKVEVKKETTITVTRKKSNNCWDAVFNSARHGISAADTYIGNVNPGRADYGYRVFLKLKTDGQVLTMTNCCIQSHTITVNADGITEETIEFMTYIQPIITAGTTGTDNVTNSGTL